MGFPSLLATRLAPEDKLDALRRLDSRSSWDSLDDKRYCTVCHKTISGRQVQVVGGTNGLRALRLKCSTTGCLSTPSDWTLPKKTGIQGQRQKVRPAEKRVRKALMNNASSVLRTSRVGVASLLGAQIADLEERCAALHKGRAKSCPYPTRS